jgi:hypothetical protein
MNGLKRRWLRQVLAWICSIRDGLSALLISFE